MSDLPVREIVLYKHGVGFFRREGKLTDDKATLTFRHDEINDVLKSLAVFDREGGQVLGIHYQTPLDHEARLADSSIRLSDEASLCDLIRDLRGRTVEMIFSEESVRGQVLGLDIAHGEERLSDTMVSIVRETNGEVATFRLKTLRGLRLLDARAEHDLFFFLDTSKAEDLRRDVTIRLSPGKHKLVVYYVAPSPTWRVSYRLVAEAAEDGQSGRALLQGWGLFDNRLEEDLNDVQVTLVAGQPISFIYDLYASHIPQRPVVQDEARIAPGPVEFRAEAKGVPRGRALREHLMMDEGEVMRMAAPAPAMMAAGAGLMPDVMMEAAAPIAEGREAGEFFTYAVTAPVTVKRGESALVPIIGADVAYSRELLYNAAKLPTHPVAALRFANTSGLTLERGPVTVVEDGEYKGEALVPFTRADNEVYLAFAVEMGIRVTERTSQHTEMAGLSIRDDYLLINEYQVRSTAYLIENTTAKDHVVTVEAPIHTDFELVRTPEPDAQTATERRWRVSVPAHASAEFERHERRLTMRHEQVRDLDYRRLQRFFEDRWLDQEAYDRLTGLLDSLALINRAQEEQAALRAEREEVYARQAQLRENLAALKPAGEEGVLRARVLSQLSASTDRVDAIEARIAELAEQIAEAERQIEETLTALAQRSAE